MHNYIDVTKLRDFSKKKTVKSIYNDLTKKYKLTNILEADEDYDYAYILAEALFDDYEMQLANYEAYIEKEMNARLFMELRKSAVLNINPSEFYFYTDHNKLDTVEVVKKFRDDYIKSKIPDYTGLDWQYYMVLIYTLRSKIKYFSFDYESCFADGDYTKEGSIESYRESILENYAWHPGIL